jgi:hypothetical protein
VSEMKNFQKLCETATARPWRTAPITDTPFGLSVGDFPFLIEGTVSDHDWDIAYILGDVEELDAEANARLLTLAANNVQELVECVERLSDKLSVFIAEHNDPGADALACQYEATRLLLKIEEESKLAPEEQPR